MKILSNYIILVVAVLFSSCGEEKVYEPIQNDGIAPNVITNIDYEPLPGGASIYYTIPEDADLSYVKAVYEINTGLTETKASYYGNSVVVEGFGDTLAHEVTLYAVDRGENYSEGTTVTVNPLIPPLYSVHDDIELTSTFGGFNIDWQNPNQAPLSFYLLNFNDSTQQWDPMDGFTVYSDLSEYTIKVRDRLDTLTYGMYVKDYYGNVTDTATYIAQPLFEEEIDRSTWKHHPLSEDVQISGVENMWDDNINTQSAPDRVGFSTPQYVTIDLGKNVKLSRIYVYGNSNNIAKNYWWSCPSHYKVYGRLDTPTDDNMEGWEEIVDHKVEIPSGGWPPTQEDEDLAETAYTADVPIGTSDVRYLRFAWVDAWGSGPYEPQTCPFVKVREIYLWGVDNITE